MTQIQYMTLNVMVIVSMITTEILSFFGIMRTKGNYSVSVDINKSMPECIILYSKQVQLHLRPQLL